MEEKALPTWMEVALNRFDADALADGDLISHDWIEWALEIPTPRTLHEAKRVQFMLLSRMDEFRDHLLRKRKVCLENVRGKGYRIVPPGDQARVAADTAMRLVTRGLDVGEKILTHARFTEMTAEESARHTDTQAKMGGLKFFLTRQKRNILADFKPA